MASGRSHPIIDRFNRHLRKESKKEAVVPNAERGIETSERRDSPPEESALQNSERCVKIWKPGRRRPELQHVPCVISAHFADLAFVTGFLARRSKRGRSAWLTLQTQAMVHRTPVTRYTAFPRGDQMKMARASVPI
jgi:hypothetical protein